MAEGSVFKQGWSLDDVAWERFDASKVDVWMLTAIKAAALVEFNAPDYVTYLKRVFKDAGPEMIAAIEEWGREENQHGRALGRWAELADPTFKLDEAFARFHQGYRPEHFAQADDVSVRGSRRGEMIARCVVESGTSTYYTAIKEATEEPVLKEIAGRIAADEFRHYKLFFETFHKQDERDLPLWQKARIALGRVAESEDDELAYAYYCASVPRDRETVLPYDRARSANATFGTLLRIYQRHHIVRLAQMVMKAVGLNPQSPLAKVTGGLMWQFFRIRAGLSSQPIG